MKVAVTLEVESDPEAKSGPEKAAKILGAGILKIVGSSAEKVRALKAELRPLVDVDEIKKSLKDLISKFRLPANVRSKLPTKLPGQIKFILALAKLPSNKVPKTKAEKIAARAAKRAARQQKRLRRDTTQFLLNWLIIVLLIAFFVVLYFAYNK